MSYSAQKLQFGTILNIFLEITYLLTILFTIPLNELPCSQPRDEDALDPVFLKKLHSVLDLTDANDIHVILDNHGDMVGTAGCGNGVPMWFQQKAAPELIGKMSIWPLLFKYSKVT